MHDLADRLTADIESAAAGAPPATVTVDGLLARGRRSRTRRRIALGAGTAAAALVVGGAAWALAPGDASTASDRPPVAGQPSTGDQSVLEQDDLLVAFSADGELVVQDGWSITERIDNPMDAELPERSVALEVTDGTVRYWYFLHGDENGWAASSDPAQEGFATLEEWAANQADANRPAPTDPLTETLDLEADGTLVSGDPAVTVVDQRSGVDLGADVGKAALTTIAELRYEGERWFVWAVRSPGNGFAVGPPINTPKAGTTLDTAADYFRAQYASGEGVR